ncbi:MAG: D-alanyl-D-alanine carboxypeptidase [Candidatus Moranbacteria bacterium]|nr:D-alanyl-D-alanine carboxypeptidase [Candidatus Moranbacteria bacterium]NTW45444.1 D-alanyl-D-alanine carboxypeptidase [Candidatus Moranbacteria bacterium]
MDRRYVPIAIGSLALAAFVTGGGAWFGSYRAASADKERFAGQVAGESSDRNPSETAASVPVVEERRDSAPEFTPIKQDGYGSFAVPTAHSAILLDAATGKTLFEQDADHHRAIASITKLLTAMITVERVKDLDESATVSENAVYAEGTRVGCPRSGYCIGERLHVGERVSVRNLLKAALMNSANDAAIALAEHVAGSQQAFVDLMNRRSSELGLSNTRFCTVSGLELDDPAAEENCYSSARDVAKIAAYALRYDVIWKTMRMEGTKFPSEDGLREHEIFNTDQILGYPNLVGTKTGFTPRAGYSLMAVAGDPESGKHRLVAVVLDDSARWQSVQSMFSWGFGAFEWR